MLEEPSKRQRQQKHSVIMQTCYKIQNSTTAGSANEVYIIRVRSALFHAPGGYRKEATQRPNYLQQYTPGQLIDNRTDSAPGHGVTLSYHESFKAGDTERSAFDVSVCAHRRRPRGMVHQSLFPEVFTCAGSVKQNNAALTWTFFFLSRCVVYSDGSITG